VKARHPLVTSIIAKQTDAQSASFGLQWCSCWFSLSISTELLNIQYTSKSETLAVQKEVRSFLYYYKLDTYKVKQCFTCTG